jgi:hypothetical protein
VKRAFGFIGVAVLAVASVVAIAAPGSTHAHARTHTGAHSHKAAPDATLTVAPSSGWCGQTESAFDRPDAVNGSQIHVIYAYPSDAEDRFDVWAPRIAREVAAGDQWWRGQDPTRALRFDLAKFAGCDAGFGQLDISSVRLDLPASAFRPSPEVGTKLHDALAASFQRTGRIDLVFLDGTEPGRGSCGQDFRDAAVVFLTESYACPTLAKTAVHELLHALGAVWGTRTEAPHACSDHVHVCDNNDDVLAQGQHGSLALVDSILDAGRDDYYGNNGPAYDVRKSPYLLHLDG